MATPTFFSQLLAKDPRRLVRFPEYPLDAALAELKELQQRVSAASSPPAATVAVPVPDAPAVPDGLGASLAALATHVWRTKGKMVDASTGELREDSKRAYRHVEASLETLTQMGVTINDWLDQPYDPGLPVKVLTFQPHPGITRDTVIETVRPTVIWREQLLQLAEVVVGIPGNTEKS